MSGQHRGLPPPPGMSYGEPGRDRPPPSLQAPPPPPPPPPTYGSRSALPDLSRFGFGPDSTIKWLEAKAEEEKRSQEEERTRQEELRLEQRRVEENMLLEAMRGGVPPHLVPVIFAGMGGSNLAHLGADLMQQYIPHMHQPMQPLPQHHHYPPPKPEPRSDIRQSQYYGPRQSGPPPPPPQEQQHMPAQSQQASAYPSPAYQSPSIRSRAITTGSASFPLPPPVVALSPRTSLPRLTTNEAKVHQPPSVGSIYPPSSTSAQAHHDGPSPSPSIYFHHWQPPSDKQDASKISPNSGAGSNATTATSSSLPKTSPNQHGGTHNGPEHQNSPGRKRKAQGAHHSVPHPSTQDTTPPSAGAYTHVLGVAKESSPAFSTTSSASATTQNRRHGGIAQAAGSGRGAFGRDVRDEAPRRDSGTSGAESVDTPAQASAGQASNNPFAAASMPPGVMQMQPAAGYADVRRRGGGNGRVPVELRDGP